MLPKNKSLRPLYLYLPVVFLPIVYFIGVSLLKNAHGPYYLWRFDHPYAYLVHSLNVAQFLPGWIDHPGIPLQIIGAIVFKATCLLINTDGDFASHVLSNPELYLSILHNTLLFLTSLSLLIAGIYIFNSTKSLMLAVFLQLSVFTSSWTYVLSYVIAAEQTVVISILLLICACIFYLYKLDDSNITFKFILVLSIICSLGISSKLNFLPLIAIPFFILKGMKRKIVFSALTTLFTVILFLPVISNIKPLITRVKKIIVYDGTLGAGKPDFINFDSFIGNLKLIFSDDLLFSISYFIMFLVLILILFRKSKPEDLNSLKTRRLFFAVFTAVTIEIILVAKHYTGYYIIPAAILTNLSLVLSVLILKQIFNFSLTFQKVIYSFLIFIASCFSIYFFMKWNEILVWNRDEAIKAENYVEQNHKGNIVISSFGSANSEFSIVFSTVYAGSKRKVYQEILNKNLKNKIFFNPFNSILLSMNDESTIQNILRSGNKLYFEFRGDVLEKFLKTLEKVEGLQIKNQKEIYHNENEEHVYEIEYEMKQ